MREHALPQDVTGYKFHIIGNMTLKQFAEVAVGVVIGFLLYRTNLPWLIKGPAILISAGLGAFSAFVPFEEQPFDHWIIAFFQALYRPTQFYWKRSSKIPDPFLYKPTVDPTSLGQDVDFGPARRERATAFLHSVNDQAVVTDPIDQQEQAQLSGVMEMLQNPQHFMSSQAPDLSSRSDFLSSRSAAEGSVIGTAQDSSLPTADRNDTIQFSEPVPNINIQFGTGQAPAATNFAVATSDQNVFAAGAALQKNGGPQISLDPNHPNPFANLSTRGAADSIPNSGSVNVPEQQLVHVDYTAAEQIDQNAAAGVGDFVSPSNQAYIAEANPQNPQGAPLAQATQNAKLPFPQAPTEPNKVVGMVLDQNGQPLANTIVEIIAPSGVSARAVRSNLLGQFFITTPLAPGTYTITAENDGVQFAPKQLVINNTILQPIEVRGVSPVQ